MPVSISETLYHAQLFNPQNWNKTNLTQQNLPDLNSIKHLFQTLHSQQIEDYLLVGGIAMLNYIQGRNTQDIDLIVNKKQLKQIPNLIILEQNQNFIRATFETLQIDLLLTQNNLFKTVLKKHRQTTNYNDINNVAIATPTGLIILKLYALPSLYRQGQFDRVTLYEADITQLLRHYPIDTQTILNTLKPSILSPSDFQEIQTILQDLQNRIQQERDRFSKF